MLDVGVVNEQKRLNPGQQQALIKAMLERFLGMDVVAGILAGDVMVRSDGIHDDFPLSDDQIRRAFNGELEPTELINAIAKKNPEYLRHFLQGSGVVERRKPRVEVCKVIELGTPNLRSGQNFITDLTANGCLIGTQGKYLLMDPRFTKSIASSPVKVGLAFVSNKELGFRDGARRSESFNRIIEMGWNLCPAEVGPQLRKQYLEQPRGGGEGSLLIAMDPILDSEGYQSVFCLTRNESGLCLCAERGCPSGFYGENDRWVVIDPNYVVAD